MTKIRNPFPIIPHRPDDDPKICIEINRSWLPALLGMVQPFRYPEYWLGTLDENKQARADVLKLLDILSEAEKCDMTNNCCVDVTVILHRIDPITFQLQISIDGGETWTPDPASPENSVIALPPPVTSGVSANKCDAATNGLEKIRDAVEEMSNNLDLGLTFAEFILLVIGFILTAAFAAATGGAGTPAFLAMLAIISSACTGVYAAGKTAFDNFWDSTAYDQVLCALYCNIGDDGAFTESQFAAFIAQWNSQVGRSIFSLAIRDQLIGIGRRGLNNFCASGSAAEADCAGCDCECSYSFSVVTGSPLATPYYEGYTSYLSARGIEGTDYAINIRTPDKDTCCQVLDVKFDLVGETGNGFTPFSIFKWDCGTDQDGVNSGGALVNSCINRLQPMTHPALQAGQIFVMSILFSDCP